jgi:hypothetical protein
MERIKALPTGPRLVLVAAPLLFLSLFFTWQSLEIDFGPAGKAEVLLDGWDFWGLLLGLLTLGLTALVVVVHATDAELPETVPWDRLILAGGVAILAITLVKNLTDADSAWVSYAALVLAAVVALGAHETWAASAGRPGLLGRRRRRRGVSSTA